MVRTRGAVTAVLAVLLAAVGTVSSVGTPTAAAAASGTRYLDPVFSGAVTGPIEASYDPSTPLNREQWVSVRAQSGTFSLSVSGRSTAALAWNAPASDVQTALAALPTVNLDGVPGGDVTVSGGPGSPSGGNYYKVVFNDVAPPGVAYPRIVATDVSLAALFGHRVDVRCVRCLDVYQPVEASAPAGGRPVVVLLHGGGFTGGDKDGASGDVNGQFIELWAREFVSRGYVAVSVNYTLADPQALTGILSCDWDGSPPLGPPCPSVLAPTVHAAQYDTQAAVRWLRRSVAPVASGGSGDPYRINPDQIMAFGLSAGAVVSLDTLYRPDDPGTVGVTGPSSQISAAVAVAGFTNDSYQRAGAGPALLLTYTNDVMGEVFGFDLYDGSRQVVARANAVGNTAELASYCQRADTNGDGVLDPLHLAYPPLAEYSDQVSRTMRWFYDRVTGPSPTSAPNATVWFGDASTTLSPAAGQQLVDGAHKTVTGDFNGDGRTDILQYGPGSTCDTIWYGRADRSFGDPREYSPATGFTPAVDLGQNYQPFTGDFDGDGRTDIVWYDPATGEQSKLWYGTADGSFERIDIGKLPAGLDIFTGDFDGDGRSDAVLVIQGVVALVGYSEPGTGRGGFSWGFLSLIPAGSKHVVADLDGDHHDDIVWVAAGQPVSIWYGGTHGGGGSFTQVTGPTAPTGVLPMHGDFDGDGADDLLWYDAGNVFARVWYGGAARGPLDEVSLPDLGTGLLAATGDFNGDGRSDVLWYQPAGAAGLFQGVSDRHGVAFAMAPAPGPVGQNLAPVAGNFDGDRSASGHPLTDVYWLPTT